jgi:hypothetical protein
MPIGPSMQSVVVGKNLVFAVTHLGLHPTFPLLQKVGDVTSWGPGTFLPARAVNICC